MLHELGVKITKKAGRCLPLDLGWDGQTPKQMHPSGKPRNLDHIPPQNPSQRRVKGCPNYSLKLQTLLKVTAKLPLEALTPEARAINVYFKIQDPYL